MGKRNVLFWNLRSFLEQIPREGWILGQGPRTSGGASDRWEKAQLSLALCLEASRRLRYDARKRDLEVTKKQETQKSDPRKISSSWIPDGWEKTSEPQKAACALQARLCSFMVLKPLDQPPAQCPSKAGQEAPAVGSPGTLGQHADSWTPPQIQASESEWKER